MILSPLKSFLASIRKTIAKHKSAGPSNHCVNRRNERQRRKPGNRQTHEQYSDKRDEPGTLQSDRHPRPQPTLRHVPAQYNPKP